MSPFSRKQGYLFALLAAGAALVVWVAVRTRQPPLLPRDDTHRTFESAAACLQCHGPDGPVPQKRGHPLGRDCLRCHGSR